MDYDAELRRHQEVLRRAWNVRPDHHVLDIGCGRGQTTREAARLANVGSVLGIDISGPVISAGPDPFALANPPVVTGLLEATGFMGVTFTDVH